MHIPTRHCIAAEAHATGVVLNACEHVVAQLQPAFDYIREHHTSPAWRAAAAAAHDQLDALLQSARRYCYRGGG